MKILSIAEDNLYNLWQLELQIYHFKKLGIDEYFIPIVIGKKESPNDLVQKLSERKKSIIYYPYEDLSLFNDRKYYPPALQSYGVYKYLLDNPNTKRFLVLDVDVILKSEKDFYNIFSLPRHGVYSSPAEYNRIDFYSKIDENHAKVYDELFEYLNIDKQTVINFENSINPKLNPAGHTMLFNEASPELFKKITNDSKNIYDIMKDKPSPVKDNMAWMASIWSYYYNVLSTTTDFKSTPTLDFCWATDPATCNKPLIHMTGTTKQNKEQLFCKMDFLSTSPFSKENFMKINSYNPFSVSVFYTNLIREYWNFEPVCV